MGRDARTKAGIKTCTVACENSDFRTFIVEGLYSSLKLHPAPALPWGPWRGCLGGPEAVQASKSRKVHVRRWTNDWQGGGKQLLAGFGPRSEVIGAQPTKQQKPWRDRANPARSPAWSSLSPCPTLRRQAEPHIIIYNPLFHKGGRKACFVVKLQAPDPPHHHTKRGARGLACETGCGVRNGVLQFFQALYADASVLDFCPRCVTVVLILSLGAVSRGSLQRDWFVVLLLSGRLYLYCEYLTAV